MASCILQLDSRAPDPRLVNAAVRLVDCVCASQHLTHPIAGCRGAVAGSLPIWGPYMRWRFPNWAAKFHCDAVIDLATRLRREIERDESSI
jgi:hypothetical protein